jgi:hypothetical protein
MLKDIEAISIPFSFSADKLSSNRSKIDSLLLLCHILLPTIFGPFPGLRVLNNSIAVMRSRVADEYMRSTMNSDFAIYFRRLIPHGFFQANSCCIAGKVTSAVPRLDCMMWGQEVKSRTNALGVPTRPWR